MHKHLQMETFCRKNADMQTYLEKNRNADAICIRIICLMCPDPAKKEKNSDNFFQNPFFFVEKSNMQSYNYLDMDWTRNE